MSTTETGAHPCRYYLRKQSRQGWDNRILNRLLAELEVGVMMMVMVAVMNYHHNLRLRRIGYCEAEDEHETEQNLFHNLVCRLAN
jgi:hypothetical protein